MNGSLLLGIVVCVVAGYCCRVLLSGLLPGIVAGFYHGSVSSVMVSP